MYGSVLLSAQSPDSNTYNAKGTQRSNNGAKRSIELSLPSMNKEQKQLGELLQSCCEQYGKDSTK